MKPPGIHSLDQTARGWLASVTAHLMVGGSLVVFGVAGIFAVFGAIAVFGAFGVFGAVVAYAHPPGQLGLEIQVLDFQRNIERPWEVSIDIQVYNDTGQAKTLRGFRLPLGGQVRWTRGPGRAPGRFARVDAGETWRLANRFNRLEIDLPADADLSAQAVIWLEMNFGRDQQADVRFSQEGVNGVDWSDASNWLSLDDMGMGSTMPDIGAM